MNLPSIDRAASKSSVAPVRCRSFQRFCKARLHRRFFFFFFFFRDVASARVELIRQIYVKKEKKFAENLRLPERIQQSSFKRSTESTEQITVIIYTELVITN